MKYGTALLWRIALLALGLSSPALAVDGMLEINQACAVSTGCFSGDAAGLPVTITAAGSYRLTSNLTVPDENTGGIDISANNVSIDLNGFAMIGPVTCSGSPVTCSHASGTGNGIGQTGTLVNGISVKNGSVTGMGRSGVSLRDGPEITNLRVSSNRYNGILTQEGSTVSGNTAYQNGNIGIYAHNGSTVSDNTVYQNGQNGIWVHLGSTVSGNTAYGNGGDGIEAAGSTVSGNTVYGNTGYGLHFVGVGGYSTGYSNNVSSSNTLGAVSGGVEIGQNLCNGNTTCP